MAAMTTLAAQISPETLLFKDDGSIPNNPTLPALIYRGGISLAGTPHPAELVEQVFAGNGWGDMWRNGIFPYVHYHSSIHEVLGIARGRVRARLGGDRGTKIELSAGDIAILPAGTGHQGLFESHDLIVVGAYPPSGKYDLCRGSKAERERALLSIPKVPLPATDPVFGADGPLLKLWS